MLERERFWTYLMQAFSRGIVRYGCAWKTIKETAEYTNWSNQMSMQHGFGTRETRCHVLHHLGYIQFLSFCADDCIKSHDAALCTEDLLAKWKTFWMLELHSGQLNCPAEPFS